MARRLFRLKTLYEASFELGRFSLPGEIIDSFLLTVLGAMGITKGFALLIDRDEDGGQVCGRGFSSEELSLLKTFLPQIGATYFSGVSTAESARLSRPHLLSVKERVGESPFPEDTEILVKWVINERRCGLLGLGSKIRREPYAEEDHEFILSLCVILIQALRRASSLEDVTRLNSELQEKNAVMEKTLARTRSVGAELDRRVFFLKSLNDAVNELSGLMDSGELIQRFLLLAMGGLCAGKGYLVLFSGLEGHRTLALRGVPESLIDEAESGDVYRLITQELFSGGARQGEGVRRGYVDDPERLIRAGLPEDMPGAWFIVDESTFGFAGLGERLAQAPPSPEERDFLLTHAGAFAVFLKNAKLFEQTRRLNEQLAAGNNELRETLENLTRTRLEADGLKLAKERIKSMVRHEMGRAERVTLLDFLMILGVSLVIGLFFNFAHPGGIPIIPPSWGRPAFPVVDATLARKAVETGEAILVDARPREFFEERRIKGAVNLPPSLFDFVYGMSMEGENPGREIIVYGRNVSRYYDEDVAERLRERGHENVKILSGSLPSWEEKGFAVEP